MTAGVAGETGTEVKCDERWWIGVIDGGWRSRRRCFGGKVSDRFEAAAVAVPVREMLYFLLLAFYFLLCP